MLDDEPRSAERHSSHGSSETAAQPGSRRALEEKVHLLRDSIAPADSYTPEGVYWADLPRSERTAWIHDQNRTERKREWGVVWAMFKENPLSPIRAYFRKYVLTGMGLFVEGFTLFSIGNLSALFQAVWPQCWKNHTVCAANWVFAVDYLEIIGIICGQIIVGFEGDWIGRRFGMVQDALVMSLGTIMLIAAWGTSLQGWVICYAWSLWFYSVGVGGEYPMTSTAAMEGRGRGKTAAVDDRLHRGRNVQLSFLMQGWGQLYNQVVLIIALLAFHGGNGNPPYKEGSTQWTYRISFVAVLPFTLYLVYYRMFKVRYADNSLARTKQKLNTSGYDIASLRLVLSHYWPRLIATAGGWFANDFFFYGNKIFQSQFIKIINPHSTSVMTGWLYNLINIFCSLIGYYAAAWFIDNKLYGRRKMQSVGFFFDFVCFIVPAAAFGTLTTPGAGIKAFQFLYFFSSFWQQFGPNATTFLVAAESYPASIRATAHGFSAACGKLGALAPAILYNYISSPTRFWVVPWFGVMGVFVTEVFLPDTTGLDLREQERYWQFVRAGREGDYHGVAVHPRHLSRWERWVNKRHLAYDPAADRQMKIDELREIYERMQADKGAEEPSVDPDDASFVSDDVSLYFAEENKSRTKLQ